MRGDRPKAPFPGGEGGGGGPGPAPEEAPRGRAPIGGERPALSARRRHRTAPHRVRSAAARPEPPRNLERSRSVPARPGGAEEPGEDGGAGEMELRRSMALPRLLLLGLWAAALRDGAVAAGEALTARRGHGADAATGGRGSACPRGRAAGSGSRARRRARKA